MFGLTGNEGNHGEDAKEYWWYLDSTPSHAWMRWRYHYPQAEFPYADLVAENAARGREPEYELLDTGVFDDDRYWGIIEVDYAKADPTTCSSASGSPTPARGATCTCCPRCGSATRGRGTRGEREPSEPGPGRSIASSTRRRLELRPPRAGDGDAELLFCDNETNAARCSASARSPPYPKDGINDHVVGGAATVNPERRGTKAALRYRSRVPPGETVEVRLRLRRDAARAADGPRQGVRRLDAAARARPTSSTRLAPPAPATTRRR